jgi:hypothetical protein
MAAIPLMVTYLTRCLCKDENTPRNWFSIFLLHDTRIGAQNQIGKPAKHIHALGQRQGLEPTRLGLQRFLTPSM